MSWNVHRGADIADKVDEEAYLLIDAIGRDFKTGLPDRLSIRGGEICCHALDVIRAPFSEVLFGLGR